MALLRRLQGFVALSPALSAAAVRGAGGVGFALGNLLLARALPVSDFALVSLGLAFLNLAIPLAPLGADGIVNRYAVDAGPRLLARCLATSAAAALLAALACAALYEVGAPLALWVAAGVALGGPANLAAAELQARRRFAPALVLTEQSNWALGAAAVIALLWPGGGALLPLAFVVGCYALAAVCGWIHLLRNPRAGTRTRGWPWRESLELAGMGAAVLLLLQLERLLIPRALELEALARYGVLAALSLSPFRMLQTGTSFTLLPRLRAAEPGARARLLAREAAIVGAVAAAASLAVLALGPWLATRIAGESYVLPRALFAAAVVAGWVRVATAFADATLTAVAPARTLTALNAFGPLAVGIAAAGALAGARLGGLEGLLYGTTLGWAARTLFAAWLARPHLRA
jgi:hypothetical protein